VKKFCKDTIKNGIPKGPRSPARSLVFQQLPPTSTLPCLPLSLQTPLVRFDPSVAAATSCTTCVWFIYCCTTAGPPQGCVDPDVEPASAGLLKQQVSIWRSCRSWQTRCWYWRSLLCTQLTHSNRCSHWRRHAHCSSCCWHCVCQQ